MISKLWFKVWILHMIRRSLSSNLISNRCMECQEEATTLLETYFSTKWQFPCFLGSQFLDSHFNINTHLLFHSVPISKNDLQTQNIVKDNGEVDKTYVHVSHHLKIFATTSLHTMCNAHVSQHWSQKVHQVPELKNLPLGTNIQDKLIQNICKTQDLKQIKMRLSNNSKLFSVQNELMGLNGFMGRPETGRPLTGRCKG